MIFTHAPLVKRRYVSVPATSNVNQSNQSAPSSDKGEYSVPLANVRAYDNYFEIQVALPGFSKEQINIKFEDNTLLVTGERTVADPSAAFRNEFGYGKVKRKFVLPQTNGTYTISAEMKNGILEITVTKPEEQKPIVVEIK